MKERRKAPESIYKGAKLFAEKWRGRVIYRSMDSSQARWLLHPTFEPFFFWVRLAFIPLVILPRTIWSTTCNFVMAMCQSSIKWFVSFHRVSRAMAPKLLDVSHRWQWESKINAADSQWVALPVSDPTDWKWSDLKSIAAASVAGAALDFCLSPFHLIG